MRLRGPICLLWLLAATACDDCQRGGPVCAPRCANRSCGDDGCGGSCGTCNANQSCEPASGICRNLQCGDGDIDDGETCDPPASCPAACDDGDACTGDALTGSADNCDVRCDAPPINACAGGDGCCPAGCSNGDDSDCSLACGDGDLDDGETCDPPGSCPQSCEDNNPCTENQLIGSAANCNAHCSYPALTVCVGGDGCCLPQCTHGSDPDCPACGGLAERVAITEIDVAPLSVLQYSGASWSPYQPVILSTLASGEARIAWQGSDGLAHVTPLNAALTRKAADWTVYATEVRGLVAHDDGAGLLLASGTQMHMVRLDAAGSVRFDVTLVGDNDHATEGDRWIDDWGHNGRLDWDGTSYAAYFGITGNHGAQGNHQGDTLRFIDPSGNASVGWDWGCSHSTDVRLAHVAAGYGPLCLSDCYPSPGVLFAVRTLVVSAEEGNCQGSSTARLGSIVADGAGFAVLWGGTTDRASVDVAFIGISGSGALGTKIWLTSTDAIDESTVHLARYRSGFLALWSAGSELLALELDASGNPSGTPVAIAASIGEQEDVVNLASGDAAWAYSWGDSSRLKVVRIADCE